MSPNPTRFEVIEFKGKGDPYFGGSASATIRASDVRPGMRVQVSYPGQPARPVEIASIAPCGASLVMRGTGEGEVFLVGRDEVLYVAQPRMWDIEVVNGCYVATSPTGPINLGPVDMRNW